MNCDKYTSWTSLINSLSGNGYIKCTNKFLPKEKEKISQEISQEEKITKHTHTQNF